ncbi:hypothetical protein scyTo_0003660 [Scyliorhinus torazame]|uniref:Uncharacterized protein n=1 Tax=Scyliorhinus torazame TaxID=75743 RepID=A0A401PN82_SCYTO|nr:hypothetical protein [Scyliorhinus torazame]
MVFHIGHLRASKFSSHLLDKHVQEDLETIEHGRNMKMIERNFTNSTLLSTFAAIMKKAITRRMFQFVDDTSSDYCSDEMLQIYGEVAN